MPTRVDRQQVQRLIADRDAQLVDVLSPREFEDSHIVGAVNVPLPKLAERARSELDFSRPIIVYCNDYL